MTVKIGDESSQKLTVQPFTLEENDDVEGFSIAAAGAVETAVRDEKRKKKVVKRHKIGKTNSPRQNSNFSFKVKHSQSSSLICKITENNGDQDEDDRSVLSKSEDSLNDLSTSNKNEAKKVRVNSPPIKF